MHAIYGKNYRSSRVWKKQIPIIKMQRYRFSQRDKVILSNKEF
jgi:hypothetical protein